MDNRSKLQTSMSHTVHNGSTKWCFLVLFVTIQLWTFQQHLTDAFATESAPSPSAASFAEPFRQLRITFVTGNAMKVRRDRKSTFVLVQTERIILDSGSTCCFCLSAISMIWQVREIEHILARHGATRGPDPETSLVKLRLLSVDLPELQEVNTAAIAKNKVLLASQLANGPCLVEDTSLRFHALGGMPGPYIKWFQDSLKSEGLFNILAAYDNKNATAVSTIAFCPSPHADPVLFTGECHGRIIAPVPGRGFGWDSIFVPYTVFPTMDGSGGRIDDRPFSLMSIDEKNAVSHRGQAVRRWADWIGRNRDTLWDRQEHGTNLPGHKGLDFSVDYPEQ